MAEEPRDDEPPAEGTADAPTSHRSNRDPSSKTDAPSRSDRAPSPETDAPTARRSDREPSPATDPGRTVQARLETVVRENRFTIAVVFPAVGAATLVGSAEGLVPAPLAYQPLLLLFGTLVMRSPLVVGLLPGIDRRALCYLGALSAYAYGIELVGVRTGWPYGEFAYGVSLGPMIGGEVPLALAVFFVPLVLNAYLLTVVVLGSRGARAPLRIPVAVAAVLAVDLVLDPAAVAVDFWAYDPPGGYYGVPASNYRGWALSATVGVVLVDRAFDRTALLDRVRDCEFVLDDLVSFVVLWGVINALYGQWLAVGVAVGIGLGLLGTGRYDLDGARPVDPAAKRSK